MDDANKTNVHPPVARTGAQTKPQAPVAAQDSADTFSAAYQQRKLENEATQKNSTPDVSDNNEKNPEDKKFNTVFIILIILAVALAAASVLYLLFGEKKNDESPENTQVSAPAENILSASLTSPFIFEQPEFTEYPEGIQEKYKALYAQNQDFVGWLTVPGTSVDTPVYQASNNSYYLKHDNYDAYTKYGIPFLDMYSGVKELSRNSTIYGHNFDDGLIFDELHNYQDVEFFKQYPIIEYNTLYKDYKWKIIAAFHTNGSADGDNGYLFYYIAANMGNQNFMEFYDELQQRSYIHTGVDVIETDKILTLSTCTYFFDRNGALENARFVVVARLVRDGESEEINPELAVQNENVRYPQLYYTVFGGTNPYRNASKWEAGNY